MKLFKTEGAFACVNSLQHLLSLDMIQLTAPREVLDHLLDGKGPSGATPAALRLG